MVTYLVFKMLAVLSVACLKFHVLCGPMALLAR